MKPTYKTTRKYKCPYCDVKETRGDLVGHVDRVHYELIPEGYSAARVVYDSINGRNYNTCMICGKKVYEWNDKVNRYKNLCDNPKCRAKVREIALARHIKVYNKPTLLNDPEHQEKMLSSRKISGTYVFTDGTKMTYTGKYEKKALEFMDKVLNIPAKDIQAPGPVLEYEYKGVLHRWITDIYYIPANLLIEIKDGGSNPNNRSMPEYRDKQLAKEKMITSIGEFNYIRLTDNNFAQLLDILADMKNEALTEDSPKAKIHINEEVGGLPPNRPPVAYMIPYDMMNTTSGGVGIAYGDTTSNNVLSVDQDGIIVSTDEEEFRALNECGPDLIFTGKDFTKEKADLIRGMTSIHTSNPMALAEALIDKPLINFYSLFAYNKLFKVYDKDRENKINSFIENAVVFNSTDIQNISNILYIDGTVKICQCSKGFYAYTSVPFNMQSDYYIDIDSLKDSGVVDVMKSVYDANAPVSDSGGDTNGE